MKCSVLLDWHCTQTKLLFTLHHTELFVFANCVRKTWNTVYHIVCIIFQMSYKIGTGVETKCHRACA